MPLQILVTGAKGFVGRHVARAAARAGHVVRGIGHGAWPQAREWGLEGWHEGDIDIDRLRRDGGTPDAIIHCGGGASVAASIAQPAEDFDRTVLSTRDVLDYIRLFSPATRLVLPSSAGVYGHVETMPIAVDAPLRPASPYGAHKKIAEDLCRSYAKTFAVPVTIVRLFSVYGPGLRKQLLWDACRKISADAPDFAGDGSETRDWLHVEDAAMLLLAAIDAASPACPVVNGGTGVGTDVRRVVACLSRRLGGPPPRFSGSSRPGDPSHFEAEISALAGWGWSPTRDLEAELAAYADWFMAEGAR